MTIACLGPSALDSHCSNVAGGDFLEIIFPQKGPLKNHTHAKANTFELLLRKTEKVLQTAHLKYQWTLDIM